ncbi:MAG: S8 family serine peptidase [Chloroflexi bacterium]|nr:S8 family serine peptidase [Chloroflexota bacterium]
MLPKSLVKFSGRMALMLVLLSLALLVLQACGPNPTEVPTVTPKPLDSSSKVDSLLLEIFLRYTTTEGAEADKQKAAVDFAREQGLINKKDEVQFELELDDPTNTTAVSEKVKTMGGRVIDSPNIEGTVKMRVAVPVTTFITYANLSSKDNFLRDLAAFQGVKNIQIVLAKNLQELGNLPETKEALLNLYQTSKNEGVKVMGADKWQAAGFKGKGVKVGVVDGGFRYYQDFLGKTLPVNLAVRDQSSVNGEDPTIDETVHGTAVLEILYSLAPEAEFYPVSVDPTDNEIADALDYLVSKGVHFISMSLGGHGSSGEGMEPLNRKIDKLRQDKGIIFFISSGNEGSSHYAGLFDPDAQGFHQWLPGVNRLGVGNAAGVPFDSSIILSWEQWSAKTRTDLDLFLEDKDGKTLISSTNDQRSREPREYFPLRLRPGTAYYLKVRLKPNTTQPAAPFRLHIFTHDLLLQFFTPVMSVANPADSKGAFAVGAVEWNTNNIANYSSQGPLPNGVFKPELSAPTGVSSVAYAEEGESAFNGTSASCPEAAGLAALIKSANLKLSSNELAQVILQTVKDLGPSGPDTIYGYGRSDLTGLTPGEISLKSNPPSPPALDPNPDLNVKISNRFPSPNVVPVTSKPTSTSATNRLASATPRPIATKAVAPTPTTLPDLTALPASSVTFRDDFQLTSSGLPNNGDTFYEKGSYKIKASPNQLIWVTYPNMEEIQAFTAEVKVQGIEGNSGIYGLVFWLQSPTDYYLLSVTGTGLLQVSQFSAGEWKELIGWSASPSWNNGGPNVVRLLTTGNQLSVGVNNKMAKTTQASGSGSIGFAAAGYTQAINALFSDFRLLNRG